MTRSACFLLLLHIFCVACDPWVQRSPYSLQAAVDELHRREATKYPLNAPPSQQRYYTTGALGTAAEQDYWDDDHDFPTNTHNKNRNVQRLNKAFAKYLEKESYNANHDGQRLGPFGGYEFDEDNNQLNLDENKRSSYFRERDDKYESHPFSAFREREPQTTPVGGITIPEHSELTEQFLREVEDAQEREREERYKDTLRNLWEKYQQHENDIGDDFLEETNPLRVPPYYMLMQKKRSYPVLPWLPYAERKKRFPVAKRSTKRVSIENINLGKTDDKVAKELSELFDSSASITNDEKKKRDIDDQTRAFTTYAPALLSTTSNNILLEVTSKEDNATETATKPTPSIDGHDHRPNAQGHGSEHVHNEHAKKEHKHRKRSDHHGSHESQEEEEGSESEEHEDEEGAEEEDEEEFEEEVEEHKKKRDLGKAKRLNVELLRAEHFPSTLSSNQRQKKSIDWSRYFGIDRKKKAIKRVNSSRVNMNGSNNDRQDIKKLDLDPEQLDSMDRKLQSIEDFIIDETIKYTGAHEGIANPDEIRRLKDHVLSRLATAYSLEKMRRALEKLRQSVDAEDHLLRNVIEIDDNSKNELAKRLSVKKEQAPLHALENIGVSTGIGKNKEIHSNAMMSTNSADKIKKNSDSNDNAEFEQVKQHTKKRNGYLRYPELPNEFSDGYEDIDPGRYESFNDAYLGNKNYIIGSNQCPLIESIAERCRGVDLLSGDIDQELLPICGVHQICYLCGTTQVACDYQYLAEADSICGNNNDCQAAARSILMILRDTPSPQLGPRECLKNSCLHSAMREIGL